MDQPVDRPLRIGLVGAGPWADMVHAPAVAAHPGTELVSVWARRPEAAEQLVAKYGGTVAADPDALFEAVDAVAFAVPPSVQAPLAVRAAKAGRHLILEKPIGGDLAEATELADAVADAGVASLVLLTLRYAPEIRAWLDELRTKDGWATADGRWIGGGLLGGPFSNSPWRHERGGLLDVGPHSLDLLDAALGPIEDVLAAHRSDPDVTQLMLRHSGGRTSVATLCMSLPLNPGVTELSVYGTEGRSSLPPRTTNGQTCYAVLLDELVGMVRAGTTEHPLDVRRGLHLQRLIQRAEDLLAG